MKKEEYEYVLAFDGTGYAQLYVTNEEFIEDLLIDLESEGKLFTVLSNKIEGNKLVLEAIPFEVE